MQTCIRRLLLLALVCSAPMAVLAQGASAASDGNVPGKPFQALQQQIDQLQGQVDQLRADLTDLQREPGPAGPPGPPGPEGPPGDSQVAGQVCPVGESVIGFDPAGNLLCAPAGGAGGGMPLYDDFSGPLDPGRWFVRFDPECTAVNAEGGYLHLMANFITNPSAQCGVFLIPPDTAAAYRVDFSVQAMVENAGTLRFRLSGGYFNALFPIPTPGDQTGDVYVTLNVHDFTPVGEVSWAVIMCTAVHCGSYDLLGSGPIGTIGLNEPHRVGVRWDGATGFTFTLDDLPAATHDVWAVNGLAQVGPAGGPSRSVVLRASAGPVGVMDVLVDNVYCETLAGAACPHF